MDLTHHPMQRLGAHAAATLAGRRHPDAVCDDDFDTVLSRVLTDADRAGAADRETPGWSWLARLSVMYPNSPVTHPVFRRRPDRVERLAAAFEVDQSDAPWRCCMCYQPASVRWSRSLLPLGSAATHINCTVGNVAGGDPICRACRIAIWCLPYAVMHRRTIWHIETMDPEAEAAAARRAFDIAVEASTSAQAVDVDVVDYVADLRRAHGTEMTVASWTNDNRGAAMDRWTVPGVEDPSQGDDVDISELISHR